MSLQSDALAKNFLENEQQFHLGFLPTEQSNPDSATLEDDFRASPRQGIRTLQSIDRAVLNMAKRVLASPEYKTFCRELKETVSNGGKVIFSGCGATGRLSILLDGMWRRACAENSACGHLSDSVRSIMTGGDFALVRSVEFFEDYAEFGRQQVREMNPGSGDMLVAITEGGETSSVLGTVDEALERGMSVFLLFNNPADLLCSRLERSRKAIQDPRVTVLDLFCGPMALAGSTRLQATSSEQLIAGAALERTICELTGKEVPDHAAEFARLLDSLESERNVAEIAEVIEFEERTYRNRGKITYFTDRFLLDIFTDTTERVPTFMLPPFRRKDTPELPQSWAFVKNPRFTTRETWTQALHRPLRCLEWTPEDYRRLGAGEAIAANPPKIGAEDLLMFEIGNEPVPERRRNECDAAIQIRVAGEDSFPVGESFPVEKVFSIGAGAGDFTIALPETGSPLELMRHMAVKLILNIISTGTMVRMGRVSGNWMSWVDLSNKKLLDRGTRLLSELGRIPYAEACRLLFEAKEECENRTNAAGERESTVQYALKKIRARK